jgi:hypothetical protein
MSLHESISAERRQKRQGELCVQIAEEFLPPAGEHPDSWPRDSRGRPRWIATPTVDFERAPWFSFEGERLAMPRMAGTHLEDRPPRPGRPKRAESVPQRCSEAAVAKDFSCLSYGEMDARFDWPGDDSRSHSKTSDAYVKAGRALLHSLGVLPWALWSSGKVPSTWWVEERFLRGIAAWSVEGHATEDRRNFREMFLGHPPVSDNLPTGAPLEILEQELEVGRHVRLKDGYSGDRAWRRRLGLDDLSQASAQGF